MIPRRMGVNNVLGSDGRFGRGIGFQIRNQWPKTFVATFRSPEDVDFSATGGVIVWSPTLSHMLDFVARSMLFLHVSVTICPYSGGGTWLGENTATSDVRL